MRFFTGSDEETEVVWYQVPSDRPALPFPTVFNSWEWEEDNSPGERGPGTLGLGEQVTAARSFPGRPVPAPDFRNTVCGTPEQFITGVPLPPDPPIVPQVNGLPACCGPPVLTLPDITTRIIQLRFAQVIDLMYDHDNAAVDLLLGFTDPNALTTTTFTSGTLFPDSIILRGADYNIVVLTGTANFQQLALQAGTLATPMINAGHYRTTLLWHQASQVIRMRMAQANLDPNLPTLYVGHSYGGVVATLLAAQDARDFRFNRQILTYGMPRPGDWRLRQLILTLTQRHIINDGDPVPRLPPTGDQLSPALRLLVPGPIVERWELIIKPPERYGLPATGGLYPNPTDSLDEALYAAIMPSLLAGTVPPFNNHTIKEYIARLSIPP